MGDKVLPWSIERSEWRWALKLSLLVLLLTWLPYLFGFAICPPAFKFMWLVGNPDDQNVHLMWARQAADGALRFKDLYTTEPHPGLFVNIFALLLGWFSKLTSIPLHPAYQIARSVSVIVFVLVAYCFGALFFDSIRSRKLFVLLLCFSSGLGWIPMLRQWLGADVKTFLVDVSPTLMMPEAITFPSLCVAPLSVIGVTLAMLTLGSLTAYQRQGDWWWLLVGGLSFAALANVHTYVVVALMVVGGLWLAAEVMVGRGVPKSLLLGWAVVGGAGALVTVYQVWSFRHDPVFLAKGLTKTFLPSLPLLLASYGFVTGLASFGAMRVLFKLETPPSKLDVRKWLVPLAWVLGTLIALKLPLTFQRKMAEGLHVPLCLLAALAVEHLLFAARTTNHESRITNHESRITNHAVLLVILCAPSNIAYLLLNAHWLTYNNVQVTPFIPKERLVMPPYFVRDSTLKLLDWLRKQGDRNGIVLCSPQIGNYVPPLTGNPVFIGHWAETLHFADEKGKPGKLSTVAAFFGGIMTPKEQQTFLRQHNIRYVLVTDYERADGGLPTKCKIVFQSDKDALYEVTP